MHDRILHAEQIGIQVALGDAVADLAGEAGVELVLGDRLEHRAALVGAVESGIVRHVDGLGGDRDLVDLLPRHLK